MIGKLTKGKSFYTIVSYILDPKKDAELIDSQGVLKTNNQDIASSFNIQAKLNPRLGLKVGHTSLNFHKNDLPSLTNEFLAQIAREYLDEMDIKNTQYIIGRHFDKEHPHIHICYNRVDNDGRTISDKNERLRNAKITNALTLKYGLHYSSGKEQVKTHRLREPYKTKQEIYDVVNSTVKECGSWVELINSLESNEIQISFKYKGYTTDIQGVLFTKNGYTFSGSKIDRSFSYSKLDRELKFNVLQIKILSQDKQSFIEPPSAFTPYMHTPDNDDEKLLSKKKKGKRKSNNKGLSL